MQSKNQDSGIDLFTLPPKKPALHTLSIRKISVWPFQLGLDRLSNNWSLFLPPQNMWDLGRGRGKAKMPGFRKIFDTVNENQVIELIEDGKYHQLIIFWI